MVRVLHLRSSFEPGGIETTLVNLFGQDTTCFNTNIALLKDGSLITHLQDSTSNTHFKVFRKKYLDFQVLRNLVKIVKSEKIQVVHTHQLIELVYAIFLKISCRNIHIVHQYHTMFNGRGIKFRAERFLSQNFTSILAVSHTAKKELVNSFGFRENLIEVIYNGIILDDLNHTIKSKELSIPGLQLAPNRIHVVMVANFVWGKDHETVFKAYNQFIRNEMPQISLHFIGRTTEISDKLVKTYINQEDLDSGRIILTGTIPNAKKLLPLFDLAIMSSFSETFNQSVIEAAMLGMPLLTSDIDIFYELSDSGRLFRLFETGNPEDFYMKLRKSIEERKQHNGHSELFRNKFNFNNLISNYCKYYKKVVEA